MKVPRYNYAWQLRGELPSLLREVERLLVEGRCVLTEEVASFEESFAAYLGVQHVKGVNSGTDALILALLALGIGPGDEVVTQANTFNATVAAIRFAGATPVLVDADEESFLIDDRAIEAAVSPRTAAIVPVHLYGKPVSMRRILALAERRGLAVIEDAAQAHGARVDGRRVGTLGTIGCFSFHPSKNLAAAGDAGAVVTGDAALDRQVRLRRALGQRAQDDHVVPGLNSKLDALQAAILQRKLSYLDGWNERRRRVAAWYREALAGLPLQFQAWSPGEQHVFHLFQVRTPRRDALCEHLRAAGVDVVVRYPRPIHLQPAFEEQGWRSGQFPVAERLAAELLCLPIRPDMQPREVEYVADCVRAFFGSRA